MYFKTSKLCEFNANDMKQCKITSMQYLPSYAKTPNHVQNA